MQPTRKMRLNFVALGCAVHVFCRLPPFATFAHPSTYALPGYALFCYLHATCTAMQMQANRSPRSPCCIADMRNHTTTPQILPIQSLPIHSSKPQLRLMIVECHTDESITDSSLTTSQRAYTPHRHGSPIFCKPRERPCSPTTPSLPPAYHPRLRRKWPASGATVRLPSSTPYHRVYGRDYLRRRRSIVRGRRWKARTCWGCWRTGS